MATRRRDVIGRTGSGPSIGPPAVLLAGLLAACAAITPPPPRPDVPLPEAWAGQAAAQAAPAGPPESADAGPEGTPQTRPEAWPPADWWTRFGSPELDALVAEAQAANHDLRAAAARVEQARALAGVAGAARYPQVSADASATRSDAGGGPSFDSTALAGGLVWDLDPWGRNRYAHLAAQAGLQATEFSREALRLDLIADVAITYIQLLVIDDSLQIARHSLANARRLLAVVSAQQRAGRASGLDLVRQQGAVANAEAALPPLFRQRRTTLDALAVLTGRPPSALQVAERPLQALRLPAVPSGPAAGLLDRRPDLRQAEAALAGAHADLAAARAALWPSLQLSARAGSAATSPERLFDAGTGFTTLGIDLLATIFDGGRLQGRVSASRERQRELVENYRQTVLSAYRDIEDALAGIAFFAAQESALATARQHAAEALRLAEVRYRAGATDFLAVLDAQRGLIGAEAAVINARFFRLTSLVDLYRALGGGWEAGAAAR